MPACVAWRMQLPAMSSEAVVPDTVQTAGVVDAKATVRPELAVALRGTCNKAYSVAVMAGKAMVWLKERTRMSCETKGAAEYIVLPA